MRFVLTGTAMFICLGPPASQGPCVGCRIELAPLATVGDSAGEGMLFGHPSSVTVDRRGRVVIADMWGSTPQVLVFAAGRFHRRIGRPGDGPGEFRMPRVLLSAADSVAVLDPALRRASWFGAEGQVVRTRPFPPSRNALLLPTGSVIVEPAVRDPLSRDPALLRVLGTGATAPIPDSGARAGCRSMSACVARDGRALALGAAGNWWSVRTHHEYRVEERSQAGAIVRTLLPSSAWFAPYDTVEQLQRGRAPQSQIVGAWSDANGYLWIVGRTADAAWRRAEWEPVRGGEGPPRPIPVDVAQLYDGIVEVLDVRTGTVVAQRREPAPFDGVAGPGLPYTVRVGAEGVVRVVIHRAELRRPR